MMDAKAASASALSCFVTSTTPIPFSIHYIICRGLSFAITPSQPHLGMRHSQKPVCPPSQGHHVTYLCEANEEELVVGEAESWECFFIPILFQPVLICLKTGEHRRLRRQHKSHHTMSPFESPQPHGPTR